MRNWVLILALLLPAATFAGWDFDILPTGGGVEARAGWSMQWDVSHEGVEVSAETPQSSEAGGGAGASVPQKFADHFDRNRLKYIGGLIAAGAVAADRYCEKQDILWYDWGWAMEGKSTDDKAKKREEEIRKQVESELPPGFSIHDIRGSTVTLDYDYTEVPGQGGPVLHLNNIENSTINIEIHPVED